MCTDRCFILADTWWQNSSLHYRIHPCASHTHVQDTLSFDAKFRGKKCVLNTVDTVPKPGNLAGIYVLRDGLSDVGPAVASTRR